MKEYKIAIIVPFFGKLPDYYPYWEKTALANKSIDFFIFTDDRRAVSKGNVYVKYCTFGEFTAEIQKALDFKISIRKPYKLCDCKPVYGLAFSDMLTGYDFWGHCDIDLIFGNIRKFITDDILEKSDRIYNNGHLSLYRNTDRINRLFLNDGVYPEYNASEALTLDEPCYFDEYRGMELKCIRLLGKGRFYDNRDERLDMSPASLNFHDLDGNVVYCEWQNGNLYVKGRGLEPQEFLYVHFQKRVITAPCSDLLNEDKFMLIPNTFTSGGEDVVYKHGAWECLRYKLGFKRKQLYKTLKTYTLSEIIRRRKRQKDTAAYKQTLIDAK